ncbi:lytic murein transglycosylase [bacterium]|nr:lytic murein transglycosylase [bacterium]
MPLSRSRFRPTFAWIVPTLLFSISLLHAAPADSTMQAHFGSLQERLLADGIQQETIDRHFTDDRFEVIHSLLKVNIRQPSGTAGYERFVGDESVHAASDFYLANRTTLDSLLKDNPVDPMVVIAILQVESSLGRYKGTYPLFNVFASLTLLEADPVTDVAPQFWDHVLDEIPEAEHNAAMNKAIKRAHSKSRWAYRQLKALLLMEERGHLDPLETKGSWAGAYGMAQFIPTSADAYARDGDGDGRINLDHLEDAAASVANYLKVHRYRKDNPAKRRKAVWHYNHSDEYVNCILTLADRIEERVKEEDAR